MVDDRMTALAAACAVLEAPVAPVFAARRAVRLLGAAFTDVPVPDEPMPLSGKEAVRWRREFASELRSEFVAASRECHAWSPDDVQAFAERVDPLWMGLMSTVWDLVVELERERAERAMKVVAQIVRDASAEGLDVRDTLLHVRACVADGDETVVLGFASLGVPPHHALPALSAAISAVGDD